MFVDLKFCFNIYNGFIQCGNSKDISFEKLKFEDEMDKLRDDFREDTSKDEKLLKYFKVELFYLVWYNHKGVICKEE